MWFLFHRLQDCNSSCFCCLPSGGWGSLSGLWKFPDGRDWWWAELSKTLIRLSADGWSWGPSLLVVWPEATQHWSLPGLFGGANGGLWEGSCQVVLPRTSAATVLVLTVGHSHPQPLWETLQHQQVGQVQSYGVTAPSSGSRHAHYFVCALQEWSLCFPLSFWSPGVKSRNSSKSDSLGIPPPVVRPLGWEAWCGAQNLHSSGWTSVV